MTERKDPLAHMIPTDGLRDVDILILDAFAVAGGSASQDQAFDLIERKLWGHMAGTDKRQTFDDAIERLIQQGALVPWGTERAPTLALPPRPYELPPRRPGGKPYIPGTEYWASERDTHLSEAHRQLAVHLQEVEALRAKFMQEFEPERARLLQVVKRQIARRQMDESARNDMLVALSKLLLSPAEIAAALDLSEVVVTTALSPKPTTRRRVIPTKEPSSNEAKASSSDTPSSLPDKAASLPLNNGAERVTVMRLADMVRRKGGVVSRYQITSFFKLRQPEMEKLLEAYNTVFPNCVKVAQHASRNGTYATLIHAPPEGPSA